MDSPTYDFISPQFRNASASSAEVENAIRRLVEDFLGTRTGQLFEIIDELIDLTRKNQLMSSEDEDRLHFARRLRNKIVHSDFLGAKDVLEEIGYVVPTGSIKEGTVDLESPTLLEDIIKQINGENLRASGLEESDSTTYSKMLDSSFGLFAFAVEFFEGVKILLDEMRIKLNKLGKNIIK